MFALSPIAGLKLAAKAMVIYEQEYLTFPMSNWFEYVDNFQYGYWFMITFVQIILFFCLGVWLDQVFPTGVGQKKHAFFCCGCK